MNLSDITSKLSWELLSYVVLLFVLWSILRYFAGEFINFIKMSLVTLGEGFTGRIIKVDPWFNNVQYATSYWTEMGGRPYQEDRFYIGRGVGEDNSSIFGVFDGHAGYRAAHYCKEKLAQRILHDDDFLKNPSVSMKKSFSKINDDFSNLARSNFYSDGTTCVVALVHGSKIIVANAGDSRCIIVQRGGRSRYMSIDHKPNREDEEKRIRSLGGTVTHMGRWRVQGVLAVSRAIGDVSLQPYVTAEPEIIEKDISNEDMYLVLASDGIWDVMNNDAVARFVFNATGHCEFKNIAKELCNEALILGSSDNVTAIVVDLRNRKKVAEEALPAGTSSGSSKKTN